MKSEAAKRQGAMFRAWLIDELAVRRWTQSDLARAMGIGQTAISKWFNLQRLPTFETCQAIAAALNVSLETVLEHAGITIAKTELTPVQRDIVALVRVLPDDVLTVVRAQLRALVSEQVQREIRRDLGTPRSASQKAKRGEPARLACVGADEEEALARLA